MADGFVNPYQSQISDIQRRQQMAQMLMGRGMNPQGYQTGFSSAANIIAAMMGAKQLQGAQQEESALMQQEAEQQRKELASALGAYRGDQPYQMSEQELFHGEQPIQGLSTMGQGQNRDALIQALAGSSNPQLQQEALRAMVDQRSAQAPQWQRATVGAGDGRLRTILYNPVDPTQTMELGEPYSPQGLASGYYTPVATSTGYVVFNNRTGQYEPMMMDGMQPQAPGSEMPQAPAMARPALPVAADPRLQAELTGAKKAAETEAKAVTEAKIDLPTIMATSQQAINLIDAALTHPGRQTATGLSGTLDPRNYIPGTSARDFRVLMDQIVGKAFLQAFESLKGGGQITEIEGRKATEAIARLNTAQSDEEFTKSLQELRGIISAGMERAQAKAGGAPVQPAPASQDAEYEAMKARLLR